MINALISTSERRLAWESNIQKFNIVWLNLYRFYGVHNVHIPGYCLILEKTDCRGQRKRSVAVGRFARVVDVNFVLTYVATWKLKKASLFFSITHARTHARTHTLSHPSNKFREGWWSAENLSGKTWLCSLISFAALQRANIGTHTSIASWYGKRETKRQPQSTYRVVS